MVQICLKNDVFGNPAGCGACLLMWMNPMIVGEKHMGYYTQWHGRHSKCWTKRRAIIIGKCQLMFLNVLLEACR